MSPMASQMTGVSIVYSTVFQAHIQKNPSNLRVTDPWPVSFPAQTASNVENVSIWHVWWRYDDNLLITPQFVFTDTETILRLPSYGVSNFEIYWSMNHTTLSELGL